jgi:hypothetical protein
MHRNNRVGFAEVTRDISERQGAALALRIQAL